MKGDIYARYSSDNQREESIDGQIRECRAFAERNGIDIVDCYIDRAMSAKTDNRPDFVGMVRDSGSKAFEVVLVWNHLHKKFRFVDNSLYHKSIHFSIYITQLTWKEIPPSEGLSRRSFFYSLSAS